jgi:hypothetical protein
VDHFATAAFRSTSCVPSRVTVSPRHRLVTMSRNSPVRS